MRPLTLADQWGTRIVAGRPYAYDLDAQSDQRALLAKLDAPSDFSRLTDDELTGFFYAGLRLDALSCGRDGDLLRRAEAERAARNQRRAA